MSDGQITAVGGDVGFYREMVESITEYAVIRLDQDGRVQSWHPGAEQLLGYPAAEVLGQPVSIFYIGDEVTAGTPQSDLWTATRDGRLEAEAWRVRRDGSRFWASVTLTPIRSAEGGGTGHVLVARDLTQRLQQEVALRSIEGMVDGITDYEVIRLDAGGFVRSWNPGAQRLRQYTEAEVLGHHVSMFYSPEDVQAGVPEREMAAAVRDGRLETEAWRVRKDGSRFWANDVLSPIRDPSGELVGFVKVARDLSERRAQEQLLARQRDEILELSTPVIQVWDKVLVLPIIGTLDSARAARLTEGLLERIGRDQAEIAILDVSGVPAVDTDVAQHLLKTVEAARLMGTTSILSGVRPETAQAIVHLGIELGNLRSRSSLREALQLALRLVGAVPGGGEAGGIGG